MSRLAICLDVDGTIVDPTGQLYPDAISLVGLRSVGGLLGLCSARPLGSLRKLARRLGAVDFLIGLQGAAASKLPLAGEVPMWSVPLDPSDVARINDIASNSAIEVWFYTYDAWYCGTRSIAVEREASIIDLLPETGYDIDGPVLKAAYVCSDMRDTGILDDAERMLARYCSLQASRSHPYMMEIVSVRAGHSKGADRLAEGLGIQQLRIAAVGDSHNDVGLLRAVELPFTFIGSPAAGLVPFAVIMDPPDKGGLQQISTSLMQQLTP
jgi:HAD superfamily hydrolase (TIGR01484 family)